MIYTYESNTGDFQAPLGHLRTAGPEMPKVWGAFARFADLVHKAQMGHKKEDIIAGLVRSVASNYLNNVGKGKKIVGPIVFQGGVSKNIGVVKADESYIGRRMMGVRVFRNDINMVVSSQVVVHSSYSQTT